MVKHVHAVGLDDVYLDELKSIHGAENYEFHALVPYSMIVNPPEYRMDEIMATARRQLDEAPAVDAIIGHWDFPTTSILPILRREYGLGGPTLESVLYCENKYWARRAMEEAVPECTPPYQHVDPFDDDPWRRMELKPPFWLKPNIAFSSYLGFRIDSEATFHAAIEKTRAGIGRFAEPFDYILRHAERRDTLPDVGSGGTCIAEGIISGELCTLEGYVLNGEVTVYGVLDSLRGPNNVSFVSYQMPSHLPKHIQERMTEAAAKFVHHVGLDSTPFNMEFFWNEEEDRVWLLEVNPRISKSHCAIFRMTAGASHHEVAVDIAMGRRPQFPRGDGAFRMAAKFMPRTYQDAIVTRVPTEQDIAKAQRRYPELLAHPHVEEGMHLGDLLTQDSYSFEIADLFMGGDSEDELHEKFRDVMNTLDFRFSEKVETNYA